LDDVDRLLERMMLLTESAGLTGRVIEILMLQALAFQAKEKTGQAKVVLERALALARPEGFHRLFLDEGERMKILLQKYLRLQGKKSDGADHTYAYEMLATLTRPENGQTLFQPTPRVRSVVGAALSEA
jgi:hypothetical protein